MKGREDIEKKEETMVTLSHTGTYPGTVMIMHFDASTAVTAVKRSWWLDYITGSANLQHNLLSVYYRVVS